MMKSLISQIKYKTANKDSRNPKLSLFGNRPKLSQDVIHSVLTF